MVNQAVFQILYQIFDRTFIFDSYSSRIGRGTHRGVPRLKDFSGKISRNNSRLVFVLKCDIKKFFDNVSHKILFEIIKKKIIDKNFLQLIEVIIKSFQTKPGKGIPLGNVTSQIFANIYLNELDQFAKHKLKIKYYIRYCDDFVILEKDKEQLEQIIFKVDNFLKTKLNLSLHPDKITIRKLSQGIDFLGYVSFPYFRILRTKTKRRMLRIISQKIKELDSAKILEKSFNQSLQSYLGILKHCNSHKLKIRIQKLLYAKNNNHRKRKRNKRIS